MDQKYITIQGARENNLKNISLKIPKDKLIIMTGVSGSGKTSLAFDTIYAEGQRRYMESLSAYARQFLGNSEKPDVDQIDGLSPAIAIDQKTTSNNPRSTVGTVTEIYDYLRLLYARIGVPYCPDHHIPITGNTIKEMIDKIMELPDKTRCTILSPVIQGKKGTHKDLIEKLMKEGYIRVRIDGEIKYLEELEPLDKNKKHTIDVVVDRIVKSDDRSRFHDSLETALKLSDGLAILLTNESETLFSSNYACKICGFSVPKLEPKLFSFNAPFGACPECKGLGITQKVDLSLLIPDDTKSIAQGGIHYYKNIVNTENLEWQRIHALIKYYEIDMDTPIKDLPKKKLNYLLYGSDVPIAYQLNSRSGTVSTKFEYIEGVCPMIERRYMETTSTMSREWYGSFLADAQCPKCHGARLNKQALSVLVGGKNIYEWTQMSIQEAIQFMNELELTPTQAKIAELVIKEIKNRLSFLNHVGLSYLTLDRLASTLSGGEAQRIRLATQIGSRLTGVMYVLDEPSIGLHQRDNDKLLGTLKHLRDIGNSLIVVEHDEDTMRESDFIVDVGPYAGEKGGNIVFAGTYEDILKDKNSLTGAFLSGREKIEVPQVRKTGNGQKLVIKGAEENNLKKVNVEIPLGVFTCVTGVSGSGKSSLVNEILYKTLARDLNRAKLRPGKYKEIKGEEFLDKIINIDQSPIGRTPRSNPATYTGLFDIIRDLYAQSPEANVRGFKKGRFSFNTKGGRCEACSGDGILKIEMHFLPDVYVPCEVCHGKRYNRETLEVKFKGKSIADVLDMTVDEAYEFFINIERLKVKLQTLKDVGLGYIKLGQSSTTLSGGEAQRVKLATELSKRSTGKTIYVLDEPTTGLHSYDVRKLIDIIQRLTEGGNTVVVIEHNLDVIKCADYIIDLGPEGGDGGGTIVATGTPEEVVKVEKSYTGKYLKNML